MTVLLVRLLSIPTPVQCQFSPLHFKFHESRALFCSLFSGIPGRSIKAGMNEMPAANYSGENFLQEVEFYQHDIKQGQ